MLTMQYIYIVLLSYSQGYTIGDRCEVKYYKGEVLITLVLVLNIMPLAIIYIVVYIYSKWLKIGCLIS